MGLTEKQQMVLNFIRSHLSEYGRIPSRRAIATHFGFSSVGTVEDYLERLEKGGYLQREEAGGTGNLKLMGSHDRNLPILGKVAAGKPIDYSVHDKSIEVPAVMIKPGFEHFALVVSGDSMINTGIVDGDFVVVRRQPDANNNDIVVAMVNNEAAIKRLIKRKGHVELHSENEKYKPILITPNDDFRIMGVFAGVIRVA